MSQRVSYYIRKQENCIIDKEEKVAIMDLSCWKTIRLKKTECSVSTRTLEFDQKVTYRCL